MKVQPALFVLFLVAANLATTPSQAKLAPAQPQHELKAAQEAHQLGQEIQQQEADRTIAAKNDHCSADALHWTFVSVNQVNQSASASDQHPVMDKKVSAANRSDDKQSRTND